MKEPPDKYHTMKCSLRSIIRSEDDIPVLFDVMMRTHKLVIQAYQFIRLWILHKYHNKQNIPEITENTIKIAFIALNGNTKIDADGKIQKNGPKPKGDNATLLLEFNDFYNKEYKLLGYEKVSACNLSQILDYIVTDMLTNIENNVKLHFISYVKRFVNSSFKKENNEIIEKSDKKTETRKQINKDLYEIKEDLMNNTLLSNEKYHEWINKHKIHIFPKDYENSYQFDVNLDPQKYLKHMIYMCLELEKNEVKSFQFFPLRTQIIPKYIPIDTSSLIKMFIKNQKEYESNIEKYKNEIWTKIFHLDNSIFKQKNYTFDYRISTDCFSASIQLLKKCYVEKEQIKKNNMKKKRSEIKEHCKDMTEEQQQKYRKELNQKKKDNDVEAKLKIKEKQKKAKEEFKKMTKEEQQKIKDKIKLEKRAQFPYLEELNDTEIEELKNANKVYVDPGKRDLLYMMNNDGKIFVYSNKQYVHETKKLKYQRLLQNFKNEKKITKKENELKDFNSKTCDYKKFKEYILNKNKINGELMKKYQHEKFRKYKWYALINKKKAESKLINTIKKTFISEEGELPTLIYGDWSIGQQMRNFMPTPNIGLKRKISEHFKIYSIDEFRTSSLNYKTEEKTENIYLPDKKGVMRKIHSILTYKMENKRLGCINRDKNSVNNMKKIMLYFLKNKCRPEKYRRGFKLEEPEKKKAATKNKKSNADQAQNSKE